MGVQRGDRASRIPVARSQDVAPGPKRDRTVMQTKTRRSYFWYVTFLCASAGGCAPQFGVHVVRSPTTDFARFSSFALGESEGAAEGYTLSARSTEVQRRVAPLVTEILLAKGYVVMPLGDLTVRIASGRREHVDVRTMFVPQPMPTRPVVIGSDELIDEGALVVDVYDRLSGELVWHGVGSVAVNPGHVDDARLDRNVRSVLATFPGRSQMTITPATATEETAICKALLPL
jgi:hypothetical protein